MNRKDMWTEKEIDFLKAHYEEMEYVDIGKILNRTKDSVRYKLKDLGLTKKNGWSQKEIQYLKDNFQSQSKREIASYLNRTPNSIQIKANKLGLKKDEKYIYNVDFFECINTEEKAYWLGFIMADGYINQRGTSAELGIELAIKDIEHLKKFNKSINGNIEVTIRNRPDHYIKDRLIKGSKTCSIRLYRTKIVEDLKKQGITNDKTYNLVFPSFDKELTRHLIRGYFDGDGSICLNKSKRVHQFNFTSASLSFLEALRSWLYDEYKINSYISISHRDETTPTYQLHIKGMTNAYEFGQFLYRNSTIYLDRKRDKYYQIIEEQDIINRIKNNNNKRKHSSCLSIE